MSDALALFVSQGIQLVEGHPGLTVHYTCSREQSRKQYLDALFSHTIYFKKINLKKCYPVLYESWGLYVTLAEFRGAKVLKK